MDVLMPSCHQEAEVAGTGEGGDRAARVQFHLHINCFSKVLPASVQALQASAAISVKRYTTKDATGDGPLWIATKKWRQAEGADRYLEEAADLLSADPTMCGYMELEAVHARHIVRYAPRTYQSGAPFPLERWTEHQTKREADIHIFRNAGTPRDSLDRHLAETGFYEVTDSRQRIWTLLIGKRECAAEAFEVLARYFDQYGGIFKLELEFVRSLIPFPADYPLRPVFSPIGI